MRKNRLVKWSIILIGSFLLTILVSMPTIISMRNLEALGIYTFKPAQYLGRIVLSFLISFTFLFINVSFNKIGIGKFKINLLKVRSILSLNVFVFTLIMILALGAMLNKTDSWYLDLGLDQFKGFRLRFVISQVVPNLFIMIAGVLVGSSYRFLRVNYNMRIQNEKLNKEVSDAKLASLKEQLNPHFMFNSFSTINELVDESPEKTKKFVHHMSDLYRFVLRNEQTDRVILAEELQFAMNFYTMLKERFGESLHCHVSVPNKVMGMYVPPMSIQMLIENAIKHNTFDEKHPLNIHIVHHNMAIKITNNMKKRTMVGSHQMGLFNLSQRYKLLSDKEVLIKKTEHQFEVQIPLLS
ncbi:MAG: histidine kinase [Bacteroidota bacterium]